MITNIPLRGTLTATKIKAPQAPLSWRIRNGLRWGYIWGIIAVWLARGLTKLTGIPTITSELAVQLIRDGRRINYGVVSRRVVTNNMWLS